MTHQIELYGGRCALIDEEDIALTSQYKWLFDGRYVTAIAKNADGKPSTIYLHRIIMSAPKGIEVDHINFDKLDNQRSNLRFATRSQNEQNKPVVNPRSQTGIRGVTFDKRYRSPYRAYVHLNKKYIRLGNYDTLAEAEQAAKEGRRRYMTHAPENSEVA
jgi:HNH endonuclease